MISMIEMPLHDFKLFWHIRFLCALFLLVSSFCKVPSQDNYILFYDNDAQIPCDNANAARVALTVAVLRARRESE